MILCGNFLYAQDFSDTVLTMIRLDHTVEIAVKPDYVVIAIGIEGSKPDVESAREENNKVIKNAEKVFQEFKIDPKDIKTDVIHVLPGERQYQSGYSYESTPNFQASRAISVTLRDISKYESFIAACLKTNSLIIYSLDFRSSLASEIEENSKVTAYKSVKEKAQKWASQIGKSVKNMSELRCDGFVWSSFVYTPGGMRYISDLGGQRYTTIPTPQPGLMTLSGNVSATFIFK